MTEESDSVESVPKLVVQTTLYKWFVPLEEKLVVALLSEARVLKNTFVIHISNENFDRFLLTIRSEGRIDQLTILCHRNLCKYSLGEPEKVFFNTLSEIISNIITERVKITVGDDIDLCTRHCFRNPIPAKKWFIAGKFDSEAQEYFDNNCGRNRFAVWMNKNGQFTLGIKNWALLTFVIHSHKRGFTLDTITFFGDLEQLVSHYSRVPLSVVNNNYKKPLPKPFDCTAFYACMIGNRIEELVGCKDTSEQSKDPFYLEFVDMDNKSKRNSFGSIDALRPGSIEKNRYKNILAYDHSRVKLQDVEDDYINASYLEAAFQSKPPAYILSQAPMENTVIDHWMMILQQKVKIIIMLTNIEEKGVKKCLKYWPDLDEKFPLNFNLYVTNTKEEFVGDIRFIELVVKNKESDFEHKVELLHYVAWPDFGVPKDCWGIIELVSVLNTKRAESPPQSVLVHCSAGVGRTGAFVIIDVMLNEIRVHGVSTVLDIKEAVLTFRTQRSLLVSTLDQYKFIHLTILKYMEWRLGQSWFKLGYKKTQK